ncbi:hypothetical protein [Streptomyces sp. NPDC059479]|uniref:hypothetical protein n=1 Tax=Streptomyces sp. NPDC059479 TaxID=3346848 RepID=UPI0036914740
MNHPTEVALARQLLEGRGWPVTSWDGTDPAWLGDGRTGLEVEVRLHGAKFGAVQAATSEIEGLARRYRAGMWVVDADLVDHDLEHDYRSGYHSYRTPPTGPGLFAKLARGRETLGLVTTQRLVRRPGPPAIDIVAQRLANGALTGRPHDPNTYSIRVPAGMTGRDPAVPRPAPAVSLWRLLLPVFGAVMVAFGCGIATAVLSGAWALLPLAIAAGVAWPTGRGLTSPWEHQHLAIQIASGALLTGGMVVLGVLYALNSPGTPAEAAGMTLLGVLAVALTAFILCGLAWALVHSWFSRHASWVVPALVPALALVLPWFGGLLHTMYLRHAFDLPSEAASVSMYWQYAASLKPLGIAGLMAALVMAFAGWLRHFHQWVNSRVMVIIGVPFLTIFVITISLLAGLAQAEGAAARAWAATRAGHDPAPYFGIQGRLVCVEPLEKRFPVLNGPLDIKHPLLTFGTSGDRVWLWDPRRTETLSVRLEDVIVTERNVNGRCG